MIMNLEYFLPGGYVKINSTTLGEARNSTPEAWPLTMNEFISDGFQPIAIFVRAKPQLTHHVFELIHQLEHFYSLASMIRYN